MCNLKSNIMLDPCRLNHCKLTTFYVLTMKRMKIWHIKSHRESWFICLRCLAWIWIKLGKSHCILCIEGFCLEQWPVCMVVCVGTIKFRLTFLLVEKSTLGSPYSGFDTSLIPISPISCVMVIRVDCFFDDPSNFPEMFLN